MEGQLVSHKVDPAADIASAITAARDQSLLSHFDEALATLDAASDLENISNADLIRLHRAASRILMRRGFPILAKDCLDKAAAIPLLHVSRTEQLALGVQRAYVSVVGCTGEIGSEDDDDAALRDAREHLESLDETMWDETNLEMQHSITRIALRLESILTCDGIPPVLRGLWCLELAKQVINKGRMEDAASRLDEAEGIFQSCGHVWGPLEVRLLRLQHGLTTSNNLLADLVDLMCRHLDAKFPYGVLQTALEVLMVAFHKGDFSTYFKVQEVLHNVCRETGMVKEQMLRELQLLAMLNAGAGDAGKVLELGQSLYRDCLGHEYWMLAYLAGHIVSLSHFQIGNFDESERLALELYNLSCQRSLKSESQAAYHLAFVQSGRASALGASSSMTHQEIVNWLLSTIPADPQLDHQQEELETAADKLCLVATIQFEVSRKSTKDNEALKAEADRSIARARLLASKLPDDDMVRINADCDELMITQLIGAGAKRPTDNTKEWEAVRICDELIAMYQARGPKFKEAIKLMMRGSCHLQMFQKEADLVKGIPFLSAAEQDYLKATAIFESARSLQQVMISCHAVSRVHLLMKSLYPRVVSDETIFTSLEYLESACDRLRRELSALGSLKALRQKQQFVSAKQVCDLYQWAIGISIASQNNQAMWLWSQKRKARSLSDLLGIGVMVPASIRQKIARDESANELYQRLTSLQVALSVSPATEKVYLQQNLEEVEDEMRKHESFKEFVFLRDGIVRGIDDLKALSSETDELQQPTGEKRDVIFVDWVLHRDSIYVLTANSCSPAESCASSLLPIGITQVGKWMRDHFDTAEKRRDCLRRDSLKDPFKPMRQLDLLISPVVAATKPGDLLVFSTTSFLSSLPLHALRVSNNGNHPHERDGIPLIERNPVAYAPNLSITQICLTRSREKVKDEARSSVFFGVLDVEGEARAIYNQMERLASVDSRNRRSFCGERASKKAFATAAAEARLIHYHGHCRFAVDDPLKQCLVLAPEAEPASHKIQPDDGTEGINSNTAAHKATPAGQISAKDPGNAHNLRDVLLKDISDPSSDFDAILLSDSPDTSLDTARSNLTVPDVFNLQLAAPLVVLVGCDSASQTVSVGDESLGLITGLLCAGAASVIGASWPIPSAAGRAFSDAFYENVDAQLSEVDPDTVINLAVALQEAVLSIMDHPNTSAPYYWAGFCLYGSWLFRK
ncbi:CHAT domain-containing protein [Cladorrhinum samala]|uniref:CHAT domain-containing protein n=1 Tax=Cladorrhinum samala TaxID=585594 RepID=A0AAV9HI70_9PEZI|nr:CHAT domain-containing protein [Cladorrhinum samala]